MPNLHPYPQVIPPEQRWRLAREELRRRSVQVVVDPCRRRFRRLRALVAR